MATIATTIINSISVNPDCLFMSNILFSMFPDKHRWNAIHAGILSERFGLVTEAGTLLATFMSFSEMCRKIKD
ncbi:hypothetical protein A6763_09720 [Aeromonas caviae]|nr:hypothetical protein A6763_09720 [Aeromonas caviae]